MNNPELPSSGEEAIMTEQASQPALQATPVVGSTSEATPTPLTRSGIIPMESVIQQKAEVTGTEAEADKAGDKLDTEMKDLGDAPDESVTVSSLEQYLLGVFEDARKFKEDETNTQREMIDSVRRRNASYSEQKARDIKAVGMEPMYIGVTGVKCRAFESWIADIYMNANRKRTWSLKPTPVVDLSDEDVDQISTEVFDEYLKAMREGKDIDPKEVYAMASEARSKMIEKQYTVAKERSENMSRYIHDQMVEGGWVNAFEDSLMNLSTMKACIVKGPVFRRRLVKSSWEKKKGTFVPKIDYEIIPTFESVSPLDFYPARANKSVDDGSVCEVVTIQRSSLIENREENGYVKENIEFLAKNAVPFDVNYHGSSTSAERKHAETRDVTFENTVSSNSWVGIEVYTSVAGHMLPQFGIVKDLDRKKIDPLTDYDVNGIMIGGRLVYVSLNDDIMRRRPYSVTGFSKELGGFWYMGIPELIKSEQDIANASARALVGNLAIASGPQVMIPDVDRFAPDEDLDSTTPWRVWKGVNRNNTTNKLVDFYQPDSRSTELLGIIEKCFKIIDVVLEMPSYSYGNDKVAGAGRTASGLSMLMGSSNKGLKRVVLGVDRNIFQTIIERLFDWNMQHAKDETLKGDMNFNADGTISIMMKEQLSEKQMAFLHATNNEFDQKILGLDGRAKILEIAISTLEADYDEIKPSKEKIARLIAEESVLQKQAIQKTQLEIQKMQEDIEREKALAMEEVQLEKGKLQLEAEKMKLEDKARNRDLDMKAYQNSQNEMSAIMSGEIDKQREVAKGKAEGQAKAVNPKDVATEPKPDTSIPDDKATK